MAVVSITIPDALVPRLTAAMRAQYPQHAALTDAAAFKIITAALWKNILTTYEKDIAAQTASNQATNDSTGIG